MQKDTCGVSERNAGDQAVALRKHHRHAEISAAAEDAHNEKREITSPDNRDGRGGRRRNDEARNPKDGENEGRAPPFSSRKLQAIERIAKKS